MSKGKPSKPQKTKAKSGSSPDTLAKASEKPTEALTEDELKAASGGSSGGDRPSETIT